MSSTTLEFQYCEVCRRNHDQGRKHIYTKRHADRIKAILKKHADKVKAAKSAINETSVSSDQTLKQVKFWCYMCSKEVERHTEDEKIIYKEEGLINHLASSSHLKKTVEFWWANKLDKKLMDNYILTEEHCQKFNKSKTTAAKTFRTRQEENFKQKVKAQQEIEVRRQELISEVFGSSTTSLHVQSHNSPSMILPSASTQTQSNNCPVTNSVCTTKRLAKVPIATASRVATDTIATPSSVAKDIATASRLSTDCIATTPRVATDTIATTSKVATDTMATTSRVASNTMATTSRVATDTMATTSRICTDNMVTTSRVATDTMMTTRVATDTMAMTSRVATDTMAMTSRVATDTMATTSRVATDTMATTSRMGTDIHNFEQTEKTTVRNKSAKKILHPSGLTAITVQDDGTGNIHTGAVPPWLRDDDDDNDGGGGRSQVIGPTEKDYKDHLERQRKRKLPPGRVGANFDHSQKTNDQWLPSFGRVWNLGRRWQSRHEYRREQKANKRRKESPSVNK